LAHHFPWGRFASTLLFPRTGSFRRFFFACTEIGHSDQVIRLGSCKRPAAELVRDLRESLSLPFWLA
jgi:hypothetical protein